MKPIWVVLLTVLISGGIVGGGTFYYLNNKAKEDKTKLTKEISDLEADRAALRSHVDQLKTMVADQNKMADWRTYTSNYEKLSFKYPATWTINTKITPVQGSDLGPLEETKLTSPTGFELKFTSPIDGIGGGCDIPDCPTVEVVKSEKLSVKNHEDMYLIDYAFTPVGETKVKKSIFIADKPLSVSREQKASFDSFFKSTGKDKALASFTGSYPDGAAEQKLSLAEYFALADVVTAKEILRTVSY